MKNLKKLIVLVIFAIGIACTHRSTGSRKITDRSVRVLGYLNSNNNWNADLAGIDLNKITDLNLAFLNPDSAGNFSTTDDLLKVVETAHNHHIRIFFSIGGGNAPKYLADLMKDNKRAAVINSIVAIAAKYKFDGVDIDLENDLINGNYAAFVDDLHAALQDNNKLMTAALAAWNSNLIDDQTLQKYDFINIMSYDKTGPWTPDTPGPHALFSMAQEDFNYYNKTRKIPADRLLIGLPFYGYQFGNTVGSLDYKTIITLYPGAENADSLKLPGGTVYYNGLTAIKQKVEFALNSQAAGVMIWELQQDSNDSKSLLTAIDNIKNH
jgi:chitinase